MHQLWRARAVGKNLLVILQLLTEGAGCHGLTCIMSLKQLCACGVVNIKLLLFLCMDYNRRGLCIGLTCKLNCLNFYVIEHVM